MKLIAVLIILGAMALPAGASTIAAWTQTDISGHNLTLNYTSSFNVYKNDTLGIIIKNIGNGSTNDAITINEINVSDPSKSDGRWTGNVIIEPDSSKTIDFVLNVSTDDSTDLEINIYYNVSSYHKTLSVAAHYPGAPQLISRRNNKTDNDATTLAVNISEIVRFSATSDQQINTWNWFKDNAKVANNYDNLSASWDAAGTKTIRVNAANTNGSTDTVTWTIIVNSPSAGPAPDLRKENLL